MSKGTFDDLVDKAYYSSEREIKSRVVLEYDLPQINFPPESADTLSITYINLEQSSFSNLDEVVDQNIVNSKNYGSFEKNHFKLDGSFYLPYKEEQQGTNINKGSNYVNKDIQSYNKPLKLTLQIKNKYVADPVNGFTIVFDDNYPKNVVLTIKNGDKTIFSSTISENSSSYIYIEVKESIDFTKLDNEKSYLYISASNWNLDNEEGIYRRRIRLKKILFGLVEEYNDTEILNMNIINQTKRFCEEVPESECEFTIGNYSGEFDLLNKKGKKRLLSKRTTIKPWIGINTENGVQYEPKGIYFLDSWKNNEDETVTLTGKSVISLIKNTTINQIGGAFNSETSGYYMDLMLGMGKLNWQKMAGIRFFISNLIQQTIKKKCEFAFTRDNFENNTYAGSWWINTRNTKSKTLLELIQKLAVAGGCYIYEVYDIESEFDEVYFGLSSGAPEKGQEYIFETITLDDMLSEPIVTKIDKINKVKISQTNLSTSQSSEVPTYSPTKIEKVLDYDYEIIPVFFDNPTLVKEEAEMTLNNEIARSDAYDSGNGDGSTISYYQSNFYMMFLNTKLKKGQTYSKTINLGSMTTSEVSIEFSNKIDNKTPDVVLEINNELLPFIQNAEMKDNCKKMADYYLDNATQYKVSFEFFGNARLQPAQIARVQTRYGYIDVWVEKTEFNYDGGLTCKVEGVSTGGLIDE